MFQSLIIINNKYILNDDTFIEPTNFSANYCPVYVLIETYRNKNIKLLSNLKAYYRSLPLADRLYKFRQDTNSNMYYWSSSCPLLDTERKCLFNYIEKLEWLKK